MSTKFLTILALSTLCLTQPLQLCADYYAGFEYGFGSTDQPDYKDTNPARISFGMELGNHLNIEAAYAIVGNYHHKEGLAGHGILTEVKGVDLLAIGKHSASPDLDIQFFAGFFFWRTNLLMDKEIVLASDSGNDLTYGMGFNYHLSEDWRLGAKIQRYSNVSDANIDTLMATVQYRF